MDQSTNTEYQLSAHTAGPWRQSRLDIDDIVRGEYGDDGVYVATVRFSRGDIPDAEVEANARLIAAAPELLAVLKGILSQAGSSIDTEWLERASLAIAQAEGRTP